MWWAAKREAKMRKVCCISGTAKCCIENYWECSGHLSENVKNTIGLIKDFEDADAKSE